MGSKHILCLKAVHTLNPTTHGYKQSRVKAEDEIGTDFELALQCAAILFDSGGKMESNKGGEETGKNSESEGGLGCGCNVALLTTE